MNVAAGAGRSASRAAVRIAATACVTAAGTRAAKTADTDLGLADVRQHSKSRRLRFPHRSRAEGAK